MRVGPGDDCAVLVAGDVVVSTDMSIEDVHFRRDWLPPSDIAFRAVTAALSDLAAMASTPLGVLVSLALPRGWTPDEVEALGRGVGEACQRVDAAWLGGDLTAGPAGLVIDVTVLGQSSEPVLRSGARPGHEVWVTGFLGASAAAVRIWRSGGTPDSSLVQAFSRPVARIQEALWLREAVGPAAMIDLSDGLVGDMRHVATASGVSVTVDGFRIPVHPSAQSALGGHAARLAALSGGEDYELCVAAPPGELELHAGEFEGRFGIPLTLVGTVNEGSGVYVRTRPDGPGVEAGPEAGFEHFTDEADSP